MVFVFACRVGIGGQGTATGLGEARGGGTTCATTCVVEPGLRGGAAGQYAGEAAVVVDVG